MTEFTATITVQTREPLTETTLFDVAAIGGAATGEPGSHRITTTLTVDAADALDAAPAALAAVGSIVTGEVIQYTIMTTEEHDRQTDAPPFPELVGVSEIAEHLDVSRQRASQLQTHRDFPAPVQVLRSGPVWRLSDLSRFVASWERRGGRPRVTN